MDSVVGEEDAPGVVSDDERGLKLESLLSGKRRIEGVDKASLDLKLSSVVEVALETSELGEERE